MADPSLLDLDLESLSKVTVVSSTKSEVSIQMAPSVVRLFTSEDISQHQFLTLGDILKQVPGVDLQAYRGGHNVSWVRGVQSRYNNKTLLLIDGVPMRDSYYGNYTMDDMLPVEQIDRIEVLNGPGSVLYGANSFAGVVSVTTRKKGNAVSTGYGSFGSWKTNGQVDVGPVFVNVSVSGTRGFAPALNVDGLPRVHDQHARNVTGLVSYNAHGLQIVGSYTDHDLPYTYREASGSQVFHRNPVYGMLSYKHALGDDGALSFRAFYDHYAFSVDKTSFSSTTSLTLKKQVTDEFNTEMRGAFLEYSATKGKHDLIFGTSYNADRSLDTHEDITLANALPVNQRIDVMVEQPNRNIVGVYAQDVVHLSPNLLVTGGARYDRPSRYDNKFTYRVGVTGMFTENYYAKLLAGSSYRVPVYREYAATINFNPNLKPESITTVEAQIGRTTKASDVSLTFYYNHYTDFIQELWPVTLTSPGLPPRTIDDETSFNGKSRDLAGLELFGRLRPVTGLDLVAGLSWKFLHKETLGSSYLTGLSFRYHPVYSGSQNINYLNDWSANVSASYSVGRFHVGLAGNWISDRAVSPYYQADVPAAVRNAANSKGFVMLNAFTSFALTRKISLEAKINNLADTRAFSPAYGSYGGPEQYDIQWPGRTYWVSLKYKF